MAIIQWSYKLSNWRRLVHNKSKMLYANWHSQLILKSNRKQRGIKSHTHDQFKLTEIKVTYFKQKWLFCTKPFINLLQIMVKIIVIMRWIPINFTNDTWKFIGKYKLKVKYNIQTHMEPCKHMLSIQNRQWSEMPDKKGLQLVQLKTLHQKK